MYFFFNDPATPEISTLSLHDALPISARFASTLPTSTCAARRGAIASSCGDRKSTRLNSSHSSISYAVFCLKKKKNRDHDESGKAEDQDTKEILEHARADRFTYPARRR